MVSSPTCKSHLPSPCSPDLALGIVGKINRSAAPSIHTPSQLVNISSNNGVSAADEEEDTDVSEIGPARTLRTPSVVVTDYCDDPFLSTSTLTFEQIEHLRAEFESDRTRRGSNTADSDSGSATSSWSSWGLDPDQSLRNQRKTSDCSTCSTLSGEEEEFLMPVILQPVVLKKVIII